MALRYSTGAVQLMMGRGSFRDAFENGKLEIYTGAQPANCETAVSGTLLCTVTAASAARTAEVLASGTVTLNTGASGSVTALTVNGVDILGVAVPFNTSLTQTAADVATQCSNFKGNVEYNVTSAGTVITIQALNGTGASPNGFVVTSTATTITKTDVNLAGGVAAANGLKFLNPVGGVLNKDATTWSGVNAVTGTAGWYRFYGSVADAGGTDATNTTIREDGAIATSAAELNMASTTLTAAATTTITQWQRTLPKV
jgi:hypothetical protein